VASVVARRGRHAVLDNRRDVLADHRADSLVLGGSGVALKARDTQAGDHLVNRHRAQLARMRRLWPMPARPPEQTDRPPSGSMAVFVLGSEAEELLEVLAGNDTAPADLHIQQVPPTHLVVEQVTGESG